MRDNPPTAAQELLSWYDQHARSFLWRAPPGASSRTEPYHVWLSEIMLQQTTVVTVKNYFHRFTTLWPTLAQLAAATDDQVMAQWAGLGYYARARNLIKCAKTVITRHDGTFPTSETELLKLPGIGPYTAAAIAAIAFDQPATVVDGNIERVISRQFALTKPLPGARAEIRKCAALRTPQIRPGDYAQALMDLGAIICTPRKPKCGLCPWQGRCLAHAKGIQETLPAKPPKKPKPTRYGVAYVAQLANGAVVLERRPAKGLLGGTLGWPGSDWTETAPTSMPPFAGEWKILPGEVRHSFTHFHLNLKVCRAQLDILTPWLNSVIVNHDFDPATLPTVMRKVWQHTVEASDFSFETPAQT